MKKYLKTLAIGLSVAMVLLSITPVYAAGSIFDNGIFGTGNGDLGEFIILDELFGRSDNVFGFGNDSSLGDLYILNQLFGSGTTTDLFKDTDNLGNLFILDRLFANDGIFRGGSDLGDLMILDELFGNNIFSK